MRPIVIPREHGKEQVQRSLSDKNRATKPAPRWIEAYSWPMNASPRFGYGTGTSMTSVEQVRQEALWAAGVGFQSFWVSQIFGIDPIVALAALGDAASSFGELGTSVVPLAGRHPLALGASARTAQSALSGRFTLGIGPSHAVVTEGFFGEPYSQAFSRTATFVIALEKLLKGEPVDVVGEQLFAKGWLNIEASPVPILLAALGPKMLELAGRLTAGTTLGSCGPKTIATHIAPRINEAAADAGKPAPRIVALVEVAVTNDPESIRAEARAAGGIYADLPSYRRVLDIEGVESGADLILAGGWTEIEDGLQQYADAGVTDFRVVICSEDPSVRHRTQGALAEHLD